MKHGFLVCPPNLNQAFESECSAGGTWGNGITRRTFIKRTGGATVASLVAWNMQVIEAQTETQRGPSDTSGSADVKVSIPGCDLGLEKDESGYRSECQKKQGNQYEWKYTLPDWTLPHDLAEDELTAPPNYRTITAKATPPDASISFKLVGEEKDCIAFETANEGNGIYKIKVTSKKQSTPDSQGKRKKNGTVIEAWHKGKRVGSANFYVIVPKSLKRSKRIPGENNVIFDIPRLAAQKPGIVSFAEYEGQPVNWALEKGKTSHDEKSYFETQSVEILDQYGVSLGAMYEGSSVREDSNWIAWMKANGSYNDPVGVGGPDELMPNQYIPFVWEITVAGYNLGTLSRKLTIELDDGVKANYKLEYDD